VDVAFEEDVLDVHDEQGDDDDEVDVDDDEAEEKEFPLATCDGEFAANIPDVIVCPSRFWSVEGCEATASIFSRALPPSYYTCDRNR
jgi:hypothetical protein